jgi:hypothetical protein
VAEEAAAEIYALAEVLYAVKTGQWCLERQKRLHANMKLYRVTRSDKRGAGQPCCRNRAFFEGIGERKRKRGSHVKSPVASLCLACSSVRKRVKVTM